MKLQDRKFNIKHIENLLENLVKTSMQYIKNEEMKDITNMIIAYNGFLNDGTVFTWLEMKSDDYLNSIHDELHDITNMVEVDYMAIKPVNKPLYKSLITKHQTNLMEEAQRINCNPGNTYL